jgi:type I restriction enzyme S subunit
LYNEIKLKYGVPAIGDLLITAVGTLGNIWKVDGRRFYYKDGNLIRLGSLKLEPDYLIAYLADGNGKKKVLDSAAGSNQKALTMVKLNEIQISTPSHPEQAAIGEFFRTLDNTITLHQRKLEGLRELKRGYLQLMFPQAGERVPRVRFEGFYGDWEQKTLNDVAEIIGGGTPSTSIPEYWGGDIDWYSPMEIGASIYTKKSHRKITDLGLAKSSAIILPANRTILFTSRAGIGDMAILMHDAATNQGFQSLVIKDGYNVYFTYSMGHLIKEYALRTASGSTFLEISGKMLGKMAVRYPATKEQNSIGDFFRTMDTQITALSTKIERLKELKSAYLQKMFV